MEEEPTSASIHLIGYEIPDFGGDTDDQKVMATNFSKHFPNLTEIYFGYQIVLCASADFKELYVFGPGIEDCYRKWGLESFPMDLAKITAFNQNDIEIKQIFMNPMSDLLFVISTDGHVYGIGNDDLNGQMGIGAKKIAKVPKLIPFFSNKNVIDIQSTGTCSVALCVSDAKAASIILSHWSRLYHYSTDIEALIIMFSRVSAVYATDSGFNGEDGLGKDAHIQQQQQTLEWNEIETFTDHQVEIVQISVGNSHTLFLDDTGCVWATGYGGQLGLGILCLHVHDLLLQNLQYLGDKETRYSPTIIEYFKDNDIRISDIAAGGKFSLALDVNGKLYAWGDNYAGKCGYKCDTDMNLSRYDNERYDVLLPRLIEFEDQNVVIKEIGCGGSHSYCRTTFDEYYFFGENYDNECMISIGGDTDDPTDFVLEPMCINDIITNVYPNRNIEWIKVGHCATAMKLM